jgi:hypothetical protein
MHGSKAKGADFNGFDAQCELECSSSLKKMFSNLEKIGSHNVLKSKGFMSQVIFASFKL